MSWQTKKKILVRYCSQILLLEYLCSYATLKKPELDFLVHMSFHLILINKSIQKRQQSLSKTGEDIGHLFYVIHVFLASVEKEGEEKDGGK